MVAMKNMIYVLESFFVSWAEADCDNKCDSCPFGHIIYEYADGDKTNLCEVLGTINDEMEAINEKLEEE